MQPGPLNAESLPPGTLIGPWRIVDLRGRGAYGSVYLATSVAPGPSGDVALKLALAPRDKRFAREAGLLSRVSHPCIPRLIDQGQWLSPFGLPHPFLVMEWLEGIPLYVWARDLNPSSRKVLGLLAGMAQALAAVHSMGGVHRDVKGDNILARLKDGRGFLMDFGSSHYRGAETLTWQVFPPGTPTYRSPEAYQFALNIRTAQVKVYSPGPAEDLFALGVTAYRLVTGQYPPAPEPLDPEYHVWNVDGPGPRPARELNPGCCLELSALIARMLSLRPEARGSACELAEALEQAVREAGLEADAPLFLRKASRSVEVETAPQRSLQTASHAVDTEAAPQRSHSTPAHPMDAKAVIQRHSTPLHPVSMEATPPHTPSRAAHEYRRPWLLVGFAAGVVVGAAWMLSLSGRERVAQEQEEARDAGTVAVGDSVLTAPAASTHAPSAGSPIAWEMPSEPLPGQIRPDARGRCPRPGMVPINGGCWVETKENPKDCAGSEHSYVYKGACYMPANRRSSPPTSSPVESRDGG